VNHFENRLTFVGIYGEEQSVLFLLTHDVKLHKTPEASIQSVSARVYNYVVNTSIIQF